MGMTISIVPIVHLCRVLPKISGRSLADLRALVCIYVCGLGRRTAVSRRVIPVETAPAVTGRWNAAMKSEFFYVLTKRLAISSRASI
jgi:hypothetical protein